MSNITTQKGIDRQDADIKKPNLVLISVLYLLGLFIGALDTGIVSPARTIIQGGLGVDDKTGIWMISIYTLAYAASIPVAGKLADKLGRKYIYIISIFLFGLGSAICALSSGMGSFTILLIGRVIQALGGGGIVPIATAEFGTSFPEEKRGMALGLVGGVYGIANILGSTAGSAILNIAGNENWKWLFLINVPVCAFVVTGSIFALSNKRAEKVKRIDKLGILVLVTMILMLLYGLRNISFFNFADTITSTSVYPFLIAFIVLLPLFILIEKKAEDPVLNLSYFTNKQILITLIAGFIVGVCIMGMVFVPQFSENALKMPSGTGGYFVALLGVFAGVAAPLSGKLIDKYGPKAVMIIGFLISIIGGLFLAFVTVRMSNMVTVCISLSLIGLDLGFIMGAPLNYMMLENTKKEDSNSALATLSLIRSVGTVISPAIMIGFIAQAGLSVQGNLMDMLPAVPTQVNIVQMDELSKQLDSLKANPKSAEMLKDVNIPDFKNMGSMSFDMSSSDGSIPEDILKSFQSADVTNITDRTKVFAARMFDDNVPPVIKKIQDGVQTGTDKMKEGLSGMDTAEADMKKGADGIETGISNMSKAYTGISTGVTEMKKALDKQDLAIAQMKKAYNKMKLIATKAGTADKTTGMSASRMTMVGASDSGASAQKDVTSRGSMASTATAAPIASMASGSMPAGMTSGNGKPSGSMNLETLAAQIKKLESARAQLAAQVKTNTEKKEQLAESIKQAEAQKQELLNGIAQMKEQKVLLTSTVSKMEELKAAVPTAFDEAKTEYLSKIEDDRNAIEDTFQSTINVGYKQMYLTVVVANALAFLVLLFYHSGRKKREQVV